MKIALLVAGALRGRALGTLVELRAGALRALGHDLIVAVPTTAGARDLEWLRQRGLETIARSCRDVCLELLPGAARTVTSADAVYVVYGAYDPLLETVRLFRTRPRLFEFAGLRAPARGASLGTCEARAQDHARLALARAATVTLTATPHLTRELAAAIGALEEDVATVPLTPPASAASSHAPARDRGSAGPLLVTVGRPAPHKRLDVLIEAVARVRRAQPDVHLVVAGDCTDPEAAAARADALAWARALGVERHVQFRGFLEDDTLAALLTSADATVFGADSAGHGLAAALARQLGCRVLTGRAAPELAAVLAAPSTGAIHTNANDLDPAPWSSWLSGPPRDAAPPSLVPLIEHLERAHTPYADSLSWPLVGPALSALRWKTVRHLHKFFGLVVERQLLDTTHDAARQLNALDRDVAALESALAFRVR